MVLEDELEAVGLTSLLFHDLFADTVFLAVPGASVTVNVRVEERVMHSAVARVRDGIVRSGDVLVMAVHVLRPENGIHGLHKGYVAKYLVDNIATVHKLMASCP